MFSGDASLKSLDLSRFDTQKTRYMGTMFKGCTGGDLPRHLLARMGEKQAGKR